MKKCLLIYNPHSGKNEVKKYLKEIEHLLNKKDYEVEINSTKYKGHAIEIVENTAIEINLEYLLSLKISTSFSALTT